MIITRKFLEKHNACTEGKEFFLAQGIFEHEKGILNLHAKGRNDWANWLIVRLMTHTQKIKYAVFAAKQVLQIYEHTYPNDDKPRKAITAALNYLKKRNARNQRNAAYAAYVARAAANAAYATRAAAYAACAAANAACAAANAAYAACATRDAAYATRDAAYATVYAAATIAYGGQVSLKILKYGLKLLKQKKGK